MRPPRPCQDLCAGVTCTSPPNPLCYPFTGTCTSGTCSYTPFPDDTSCIFGTNDFGTYDGTCQGGECLVSPETGDGLTGWLHAGALQGWRLGRSAKATPPRLLGAKAHCETCRGHTEPLSGGPCRGTAAV
jgi:hypothetical protein